MCIWEACLLKNVIMIIAAAEMLLDFYRDEQSRRIVNDKLCVRNAN